MDPNFQSAPVNNPEPAGLLAAPLGLLSQGYAGIVEAARKITGSSSVDTTGQVPASGGRRRRMRGGSNINIPILPGSYDAIVAPPPAAPAPAPVAAAAPAPVAAAPAPPAPAPAVKAGGSKRRRSRSHSGGKSKRTKKSKRSKSRSRSRSRK